MLLVVNIGNTNIRLGIFQENQDIITWILDSKSDWTKEKLQEEFNRTYKLYSIDKHEITSITIGSVVPLWTEKVADALEEIHHQKPFIVTNATPSFVQHSSPQMGTDLYANAVAAQTFYQGKKLVVDFGTALTFIGIDENGKILGVTITTGVVTAMNALVKGTAQLQEIEFTAPKKVLGKDTISCIQSGIIYGYLSMVEGMIDRINNELNSECTVIATGGMSLIFKPLTNKIHYVDQLHTLKGIAELYYQNH
ncbi:MAG: type III pantothenate kinase [Weeksellaceae bacterium]|jgi:type III pantothenate kinase|nr:type III pantothenate kinase [Weeksellaceae bacterium]